MRFELPQHGHNPPNADTRRQCRVSMEHGTHGIQGTHSRTGGERELHVARGVQCGSKLGLGAVLLWEALKQRVLWLGVPPNLVRHRQGCGKELRGPGVGPHLPYAGVPQAMKTVVMRCRIAVARNPSTSSAPAPAPRCPQLTTAAKSRAATGRGRRHRCCRRPTPGVNRNEPRHHTNECRLGHAAVSPSLAFQPRSHALHLVPRCWPMKHHRQHIHHLQVHVRARVCVDVDVV